MSSNDSQNGQYPWGYITIAALTGVLIVFVALSFAQYQIVFRPDATADSYSASGDFFGFANAVFSALAFAMIIVTLWMQKHELELQRQEIRDNRIVLENQKEEMAAQNESLARSNFEGLLLALLRKQIELTNEMQLEEYSPGEFVSRRSKPHKLFGDAAIESSLRKVRSICRSESISAQEVGDRCDRFFQEEEKRFGRYTRNLSLILELIATCGFNSKPIYRKILKAQLSNVELELIFWFGLCNSQRNHTKRLIEDLSILENIHLADRSLAHLKKHYAGPAFSGGH